MEVRVGRSVADRRFAMLLVAGFAVVALVLAAVGVYGVISYTVVRRTREIGLRVALGAPRQSVARLVLAESLRPVLLGAALGALAGAALARLLGGMLYGVRPLDPATLAAAAVLLPATAALASWLPARRAARIDPAVTLRAD